MAAVLAQMMLRTRDYITWNQTFRYGDEIERLYFFETDPPECQQLAGCVERVSSWMIDYRRISGCIFDCNDAEAVEMMFIGTFTIGPLGPCPPLNCLNSRIWPKLQNIICKCAGKITKIVATRCQILRLKCTKFDLFWRAYSAPHTP